MRTRPIINIQEINPMLYRYVEELREVGVSCVQNEIVLSLLPVSLAVLLFETRYVLFF